jgi:hypothetical protein
LAMANKANSHSRFAADFHQMEYTVMTLLLHLANL